MLQEHRLNINYNYVSLIDFKVQAQDIPIRWQ